LILRLDEAAMRQIYGAHPAVEEGGNWSVLIVVGV